jgi:AcrR family transcriptional regulator
MKGFDVIKQPEITAATQKAFIDAFCYFYKEKPIEKITIQEISSRAGYNRCTFYQYFKDTYDLLDTIENETLSYIEGAVTANLGHVDISEVFILSFSNLPDAIENYAGVLLANQNSTKFVQRAKAKMMPVILKEFGISEHDIKSLYVLEFHMAGIISLASRWYSDNREMPMEELGEIIHTLLTEGVLSAIGRNGQGAVMK